jgi:hypothetical protein
MFRPDHVAPEGTNPVAPRHAGVTRHFGGEHIAQSGQLCGSENAIVGFNREDHRCEEGAAGGGAVDDQRDFRGVGGLPSHFVDSPVTSIVVAVAGEQTWRNVQRQGIPRLLSGDVLLLAGENAVPCQLVGVTDSGFGPDDEVQHHWLLQIFQCQQAINRVCNRYVWNGQRLVRTACDQRRLM